MNSLSNQRRIISTAGQRAAGDGCEDEFSRSVPECLTLTEVLGNSPKTPELGHHDGAKMPVFLPRKRRILEDATIP